MPRRDFQPLPPGSTDGQGLFAKWGGETYGREDAQRASTLFSYSRATNNFFRLVFLK